MIALREDRRFVRIPFRPELNLVGTRDKFCVIFFALKPFQEQPMDLYKLFILNNLQIKLCSRFFARKFVILSECLTQSSTNFQALGSPTINRQSREV